jgi:hypothetical protein
LTLEEGMGEALKSSYVVAVSLFATGFSLLVLVLSGKIQYPAI